MNDINMKFFVMGLAPIPILLDVLVFIIGIANYIMCVKENDPQYKYTSGLILIWQTIGALFWGYLYGISDSGATMLKVHAFLYIIQAIRLIAFPIITTVLFTKIIKRRKQFLNSKKNLKEDDPELTRLLGNIEKQK